MEIPWLMISVVIGLIVLGLLVVFAMKRKQVDYIDYKQYFDMGIIWVGVGVVFTATGNPAMSGLFIMGIVFMALGWKHKDKWGKKIKLSKDQIKMRKWSIVGGVLLLLLGILTFILFNEGIV